MDELARKRMRTNLVKALAWIIGGAIAIALVEWAWDAGYLDGQAHAQEGKAASEASGADPSAFNRKALLAFALQDDAGAVGLSHVLPADFVAECFSPASLGEVHVLDEGSVVGIVSSMPPKELYPLCAEALQAHGWLKVESGQEQRASFIKDEGRYRWLYLEVSPSGDASVAVVVLQEERR